MLTNRRLAESQAKAERPTAMVWAEAQGLQAKVAVHCIRFREQTAIAFEKLTALLRLRELETLRELAQSSRACIYVDFDRRAKQDTARSEEA